jgi:hypothetical protein
MTHPLSRFSAKLLDRRLAGLRTRPVTAFEVPHQTDWDVANGRYVFLIERWSIEGIVPVDKLAFAGCSADGTRFFDEDTAERVLIEGLSMDPRMIAMSPGDCSAAHALASKWLASRLKAKREDFEEGEAARHFDLISTQQALTAEHRRRETERYKSRISDLQFSSNLKRRNLIPALEGKLQKVLARLELREAEIRKRESSFSYDEPLLVGVAVVDIVGSGT